TEVVGHIIDYSLSELALSKIVAETQTANTASCKLLEKLGMTLERIVYRFNAEQAIYSAENPSSEKNEKHYFIQRSEEHTSELQSRLDLVCRLLLDKKKQII